MCELDKERDQICPLPLSISPSIYNSFKLEKYSHLSGPSLHPAPEELTEISQGNKLGTGQSPKLVPPGTLLPFRDSLRLEFAPTTVSKETAIPERRPAKRLSCPEPRGWGRGVGGPICIFSINKLELSSLAWGDNLRGKSLHILFKSTPR